MESNKAILNDLEELSALQIDAINGFKQLSDKVPDENLKTFLQKSEEQSKSIWREINEDVIRLQGDIKTKGTLKGAINHLWMKLKTDVIHEDISNVLKNVELCEEFNINRYKSVLKGQLPESIKNKLQKHVDILTERLDHIVMLQKKLSRA